MFGSRSGRSRNRSSSLGRCGGQVWWAGPVDGSCIRSSSRSGSRFGSRFSSRSGSSLKYLINEYTCLIIAMLSS